MSAVTAECLFGPGVGGLGFLGGSVFLWTKIPQIVVIQFVLFYINDVLVVCFIRSSAEHARRLYHSWRHGLLN